MTTSVQLLGPDIDVGQPVPFMRERKDLAYFLSKADEYRKKADSATSPLMKATFESIVREYMRQAAHHLNPTRDPNAPD